MLSKAATLSPGYKLILTNLFKLQLPIPQRKIPYSYGIFGPEGRSVEFVNFSSSYVVHESNDLHQSAS
jgi:hypothetical protein